MDERLRKLIVVPSLLSLFLIVAGMLALNVYKFAGKNPAVGRHIGFGVRTHVAPVRSETIADRTGGTGSVSASRRLQIRNPYDVAPAEAGAALAQRVLRTSVEVGDLVAKGDLLVELDTSSLAAQLESDRDALRAAETRHRKAEEELEARRRETRATLATAEAEVRSAKTTLERDEAKLERMDGLLREGIISRRRHENVVQTRDASLFRLRSAEETLLAAQRNVRTIEQKLEAQLADSRAAAAAARTRLRATEMAMEGALVTAPWDGWVLDLNVNAGQWVAPGDPIALLGRLSPVHFAIHVPQEKVLLARAGQEAEVSLNALPERSFRGEVVRVDPTSQGRSYRVVLSVPNEDRAIRPGMTGYARLLDERTVLTIPRLGLLGSGRDATVFVADGRRARIRRVQIGASLEGGRLEVLGGLREGEEVIIHGLRKLQDGDPVRVVRH
jgi:multidrug efflux pump subunit AcrA (membrane-fusion protein)